MIIEKNKIIAPLTNFKIGDEALYFITLENLEDIYDFLELKEKFNLPIFILGGGTNLLFDKFNGFVIKTNFKNFEILEPYVVKIGANFLVSEVLEKLCEMGFSGFEWAGGLPGEIGGAIRGNAGCFGGEIKDLVIGVEALNLKTGEIKIFKKEEIEFEYRNSFFKKNKEWLILSGIFKFNQGDKEKIKKEIEEKINYRKMKHPLEYPNAGSIFKNIPFEKAPKFVQDLALEKNKVKDDPFPVIPTAFLISEAGLKGKKIGDAQISEKHANFIVNLGRATFNDVYSLIDYIKKKVVKSG
jgi:UDP-N-acetylmuramate dehydrogenase